MSSASVFTGSQQYEQWMEPSPRLDLGCDDVDRRRVARWFEVGRKIHPALSRQAEAACNTHCAGGDIWVRGAKRIGPRRPGRTSRARRTVRNAMTSWVCGPGLRFLGVTSGDPSSVPRAFVSRRAPRARCDVPP